MGFGILKISPRSVIPELVFISVFPRSILAGAIKSMVDAALLWLCSFCSFIVSRNFLQAADTPSESFLTDTLLILPEDVPWKNFKQRKGLFSFLNEVKFVQSCPTLCDPMDYSPPGCFIRGILWRILEWVAMPFSTGSSQPRDQTQVSRTAGRFFTIWATQEAHSFFKWPLILRLLAKHSKDFSSSVIHQE